MSVQHSLRKDIALLVALPFLAVAITITHACFTKDPIRSSVALVCVLLACVLIFLRKRIFKEVSKHSTRAWRYSFRSDS